MNIFKQIFKVTFFLKCCKILLKKVIITYFYHLYIFFFYYGKIWKEKHIILEMWTHLNYKLVYLDIENY